MMNTEDRNKLLKIMDTHKLNDGVLRELIRSGSINMIQNQIWVMHNKYKEKVEMTNVLESELLLIEEKGLT